MEKTSKAMLWRFSCKNDMRIDKYLKNSRLIKRRTIAKEACEKGKIKINGKVAKPGDIVKIGDMLTLELGQKTFEVEVLDVSEVISKGNATTMYKLKNS